MRIKYILIVSITVVQLAVIPINLSAAATYYKNTYREGYAWTESIMRMFLLPEYVFSSSTGRVIDKQALKFCKSRKTYGEPTFSPNALKGCVAAIKAAN